MSSKAAPYPEPQEEEAPPPTYNQATTTTANPTSPSPIRCPPGARGREDLDEATLAAIDNNNNDNQKPPAPTTTNPPQRPPSTAYGLWRALSSALGLALIVLAAVAVRRLGRGRWCAVALSPGIYSFLAHGLDAWRVLAAPRRSGCRRRDAPGIRKWWDGGWAVGTSVAAGFAGWIVAKDLGDGMVEGEGPRAVGVMIAVFLPLLALFHFGFCAHAIWEQRWLRNNAEKIQGEPGDDNVELGRV